MTEFQPFLMERWMSRYEQTVDYNLSESGVQPMCLEDLLAQAPGALERLLAVELNYPHVNGTPELRGTIAGLYPGAEPDNVLVTVGAAEANYIAMRTLLAAGDEIAIMLPNYMQIWGIAKNHGLKIRSFHLVEENGWRPDLSELAGQVSARTRLIAVCNPNNPTGMILTDSEMRAIVSAAERVDAWILADEVYRGGERVTGRETASFYNLYDKVVAVGSMSKTYGLPGLRIGWAVAPVPLIEEIWARHEYTTISAGVLSNTLAAIALSPEIRPGVLERTRRFIRQGYLVLEDWMARHPGVFTLNPPQAAAVAFLRYHLEINSTELADRLRKEQGVLLVPGDHFGMDRFLRVSFGLPEATLTAALDRVQAFLEELA